MKKIAKVLLLGMLLFLVGCIIDDEGDWEYTYLITCSDSLTDCQVDLKFVDLDGRTFMNSVSLPWSTKIFIYDRDDESITPELEVVSDGEDIGIKAVITTAFCKDGETSLERFPRTAKYNNLSSLDLYNKFCSLTSSVEYGISAEDRQKLDSIVDAFLDADYQYLGKMAEGADYLKISQ